LEREYADAHVHRSCCCLLSACSSQKEQSREDLKTFDVQEEATDASAPGVNVTAAPGVAFNYRYAFQLPSSRIAAAQEAHASACETLGLTKCRITGMRYNSSATKTWKRCLR
jgi:uncharacterized lipoprotein